MTDHAELEQAIDTLLATADTADPVRFAMLALPLLADASQALAGHAAEVESLRRRRRRGRPVARAARAEGGRMTIPTPPPIPDRVVLGANGAYWRAFDTEPALEGLYSMCPNSTDNDPVVPVMTFLPVTETGAALVAALQKHKDHIQALQELVCTCDSKHIFQAVLHDETCPVWVAAQEPPAEGGDRDE